MTNTSKLKARMVEKGLNQEDIAKLLKRSPASINYKLNNKRQFMADEFLMLCKILEIDNPSEYFFIENVEK